MRGFRFGFMCSALALSGAVAACGGDDDGGSSNSGSGGTTGGGGSETTSGGSGGTATTTTTSSGGSQTSGGSGGSGGSAGEATTGGTAGTGGTETTGTGGSAGGAGAPPDELAPITKVTDIVIPEANEMLGLTFGASGKIWGSGATSVDPENQQLLIARFNPDGTPDTDFDDDGFLVYDIAPGGELSRGIVELANGDIIVQANVDDGKGGELIADAGGGDDMPREDGRNVVLLRFDSEGALVGSFGEDGIVQLDFGWTSTDDADWPVPTYDSSTLEEGDDPEDGFSGPGFPTDDSWGIALDATGDEEKIVVFGAGPAPHVTGEDAVQRVDNDRYVLRVLASDGSLDPDFNDGAAFTFGSPGVLSDGGRRGRVEADGSILSAGYTNFGEGLGNHVMVLRLLEDGTPDTDFGFGLAIPGVTWFNPFREDGGVAECYAVASQSNGRLVTTGYGRATGAGMTSQYGYATTDLQDLVAFGVDADAVDLDWGKQGTLAIQSEEAGLGDTEDRGRDLIALPDDRTVHAGRFGGHPALFVVTPEGELDTSVGDGGKFLYEPFAEATSHFYAIASNHNVADREQTLIAATTNNHAEGVILAILSVDEE
ncbi:MAG TPA: hypothetical protein VFU02_19230 [Polyangiaceae bacterium]|nr:hypothetical protein [Polyangiaceae bacterium]